MTHEQIMAMQAGPEMDDEISLCIHWKPARDTGCCGQQMAQSPPFSTDATAAAQMQDSIPEERRDKYTLALYNLLDSFQDSWLDRSKKIAYATPADRCRARLLMEVKNDK